MDYLDFGSSDSDNDDGGMVCEMDSDEDEEYENKRLLNLFKLHEPISKEQRNIEDFEAEMEAELDRRALQIESQGGVEHQKSLSRSSSTASLHSKSPRASPVPSLSVPKKSSLKRAHSSESHPSGSKPKTVKFASSTSATAGSSSSHLEKQNQNTKMSNSENRAKEMYDELYFDSDESDGEGDEKKQKEEKRRFLSNDELFYDPLSDEKDQEWMDRQRQKSYGESGLPQQQASSSGSVNTQNHASGSSNANSTNISNNANKSIPTTDAVLNCPACFTPVCNDCQRHELYVGQYRAMFVVNCMINRGETLTVPEKVPKRFRKRSKLSQFTPTGSSDTFYPVLCNVCKTQVAMYDSEEIYHFFNVLASQP